MDVEMLFKMNPNKFKEFAKGKSYQEFASGLRALPNFKIALHFSESDMQTLYKLATE